MRHTPRSGPGAVTPWPVVRRVDPTPERPPQRPRSAHRGDGVAVLRPGLLVVAQRRRTILAVADRADRAAKRRPGRPGSRGRRWRDAGRVRGCIPRCRDRRNCRRSARWPADSGRSHADWRSRVALRVAAQGRLVEGVEHAIADIGDQILLAARHRPGRTWPRWRPIRCGGGRGRAGVAASTRASSAMAAKAPSSLHVHCVASLDWGGTQRSSCDRCNNRCAQSVPPTTANGIGAP